MVLFAINTFSIEFVPAGGVKTHSRTTIFRSDLRAALCITLAQVGIV